MTGLDAESRGLLNKIKFGGHEEQVTEKINLSNVLSQIERTLLPSRHFSVWPILSKMF